MPSDVSDLQLPDGRILQYFLDDEAGDADGLLLYHHGTPAAGPLESEILLAARAHGLTTVELVRPGYGASTRGPGRTIVDVAPLATALVDHLGCERFVTLGASGGGPHALATAAVMPNGCAGVITLGGVGPFGEPGLDYLAGMGQDNVLETEASLSGGDDLMAFLAPHMAGLAVVTADSVIEELSSLLTEVDRGYLTGEAAERQAEIFRWAVSTGMWGWFDDDVAFVTPWGFSLAEITVPVAVWHGAADLMVPFAHGAWLVDHLPYAVPHLLEGEGHLSLVAHLDSGMAELRDWLDR
jgi:pimeloyl-ACP methyl ester carboxylesterase